MSQEIPSPERNWALFLDIDGTLLDIASAPDDVAIPYDLVPVLETASAWLSGALALVSGRPLAAIDRLFSPAKLPCAAEHGAVLRKPGGYIEDNPLLAVPQEWRTQIRLAAATWPGVLIDEKPHSVALHYRKAPERADAIAAFLNYLVAQNPSFEILPAKMAFELRHHDLHKGMAVEALMQTAVFAGRRPIYIGDDVTDEDGITAARRLGGAGFLVGETFHTPAEVRFWLTRFRNPAPEGT